jgi:hypothetical protein
LLVAQLRANQLTVVPRYNLVLNIGFEGGGTHFQKSHQPWWAPRYYFNFNGNWMQRVDVRNSITFDRHYLITCHNGGGKFLRNWIKIQRLFCFWRQKSRFDRII